MAWIAHEDLGPTPYAIMSSNPDAMNAVSNLGHSVSFGASALTRVQEEAIATVVAAANRCRY